MSGSEPRGVTIWITGLPSAGKTTLGHALQARLRRRGVPVIVLDGDALRKGLSADLGFDRDAREENVRRAGHVACLAAASGIVAIACLVSPYEASRAHVRELHRSRGLGFVEVWMATPLEICQRRDAKGLYARAAAGELRGLTGVDDPYEPPASADVTIDPDSSPLDAAERVLDALGDFAGSAVR